MANCSACKSTTKNVKGSGVSFHRFPTDLHLRKQWITAIKRKDFHPSKRAVLCSRHFKEEDYLEWFGWPKLKPSAVPSLFDLPQYLHKQVVISSLEYSTEKSIKKNNYNLIHSCKKCIYVTRSLFFMQNHVKRHQVIRPFVCSRSKPEIFICKECNFETYETITFKNHIKDHNLVSGETEINLHNQTEPLDIFGSNLHENSEKKRWQCDSYSNDFNSKDLLRRNTIIHDEELHSSQHCSSSQKNNSELNVNSKKLLIWFQCDKCSYNSTNNHSLMKHSVTQHGSDENIKWFFCNRCEYTTNRMSDFKYHVQLKHSRRYDIALEDKTLFPCDQCPLKFKLKSQLKVHISVRHPASEDIKWIHCAQCSHRTKSKSGFKSHMYLKHTAAEDIKWFKCPHCPHIAKIRSYLNRHMKNMHPDFEDLPSIQCEKCPKKFKRKGLLTRHVKRYHVC